MKNVKKQIRRELNQKLIASAMIHLGGLKKQKEKKIIRYLENKVHNITSFYTSLLKKKEVNDVVFAIYEDEKEVIKLPENEMKINSEVVN